MWVLYPGRIGIWSVGFCGGKKVQRNQRKTREPTPNSTHIPDLFWRLSYKPFKLLVFNVVIDSSSSILELSLEITYRGIENYHNSKTILEKNAMNELTTHLSFTQLRFHCSKQQGHTFHVTTVANSTGEAVVQYFSGQVITANGLSTLKYRADCRYIYCKNI